MPHGLTITKKTVCKAHTARFESFRTLFHTFVGTVLDPIRQTPTLYEERIAFDTLSANSTGGLLVKMVSGTFLYV